MLKSRKVRCLVWAIWLGIVGLPTVAAAQGTPAPDPVWPQNIFFGQVPPGGDQAPVIVFVHGVNGVASDWWTVPNDMYLRAYQAGYRTAFVSLNADNTRNNDGIIPNATALRLALPSILFKLNAPYVYIVAHSKGGVDVQAAMLDPAFSFYVKGVFTLATPHLGTELADWAFTTGSGIAGPLGLLTPAFAAMQTSRMALFRAVADGTSLSAGVPYFTVSGTSFAGHPLTQVTGPNLQLLTGAVPNDGIVTVPRTKLSPLYSYDLGEIPTNHFAIALGSLVFPRINAQIQALETRPGFNRIATDGFSFDASGNPLPGDRHNSFPWSTQWFKGKLYVGTGRAFLCVVTATNDAAVGANDYPPQYPDVECAQDPKDLPLAAEIWRYTPETHLWERVYQSPQDVPIEFDATGAPTKFTARDIAFRGMAVFKENDANGTERLYIGGISASSLFDKLPPYGDENGPRFPGPRILYTEDGTTWNQVPQTPGTFLGDLNIQDEIVNKRGFRSFVTLPDADGVNRLFVTVSDLRGVGRAIMSSNPSAGDDAWRQISPSADDLPIFTLYVYRNHIYATVGDTGFPNGYAIFKTDAAAPDPSDPSRFLFTPVILGDGIQLQRPLSTIAMQEFQGSLYIGSDRPTELIRINPDDSWDLIVGSPRLTLSGMKRPLSGIGKGFNSMFNGHFYSMAVHGGELYLGTWDWSQNLRGTPLDGLFNYQYGFDLFKSPDGIHWHVLDRKGLGDPLNSSVRNLESTPFGLFLAATNPYFGLQMFLDSSILDLNGDGIIDNRDVNLVNAARNTPAPPGDPRDLDRDGVITVLDSRKLATQCTFEKCAKSTVASVAEPTGLIAVTQQLTPAKVALSWTKAKGASQYHVFRSDPMPIEQLLPPNVPLSLPDGTTVTVQEIQNGALSSVCQYDQSEAGLCALVDALQANAALTKPFVWVGSTKKPQFVDTQAPSIGQALYYVVAENKKGQVSDRSNLVAGPSEGDAPTIARLGDEVLRLRGVLGDQAITRLARQVSSAAAALAEGRLATAQSALIALERQLVSEQKKHRLEHATVTAAIELTGAMNKYVMLATDGQLPSEAVAAALLDGTSAVDAVAGSKE